MQDRQTGMMKLIGEDEAKEREEINRKIQGEWYRIEAIASQPFLATKKKKVPLFRRGEVIEVKDGKFRIIQLTKIGMILRGVPDSTPLG